MNKKLGRYMAAGLIGVLLFGVGMVPVLAATSKAAFSVNKVKAAVSKVLPLKAFSGKATPNANAPVKTPVVDSVKVVGTGTAVEITPDYWAGEDEIVQLYSLPIKDIIGDTISVSSEKVYPCLGAEDTNKSDQFGLVGPCPVQQEIIKVKISKETILLLRNRSRASLSDFAIGEQINVYGFQNKDSVEALIVRNMDRPKLIQPVELWNMEITRIKGNELTVQYDYECKGWICPMGAIEPDMPQEPRIMPMIYPMPRTIKINSKTTFSDRNGNSIQFGDLKAGDILNLSGITRGRDPNAPVHASKIQNTSIPRTQNNLSIQSFSGPGKLRAGQVGQWSIVVGGGNQEFLSYEITWGDEKIIHEQGAPSMIKEDRLNNGNFSHVYQNPGTYTLTIVVTDATGASVKASTQVWVF